MRGMVLLESFYSFVAPLFHSTSERQSQLNRGKMGGMCVTRCRVSERCAGRFLIDMDSRFIWTGIWREPAQLSRATTVLYLKDGTEYFTSPSAHHLLVVNFILRGTLYFIKEFYT